MDKFDSLEWWKAHEKNFPVLSIMAHDLLTPYVSTIAKSVFSSDNRTLNEERSSLDVEVVESLLCMKDWEHAGWRGQSWTANRSCWWRCGWRHFHERCRSLMLK